MKMHSMFKVIGIKIIFFKDWNQVGCKYFDVIKDNATLDTCKEWLYSNHNKESIKHIKYKIIREKDVK